MTLGTLVPLMLIFGFSVFSFAKISNMGRAEDQYINDVWNCEYQRHATGRMDSLLANIDDVMASKREVDGRVPLGDITEYLRGNALRHGVGKFEPCESPYQDLWGVEIYRRGGAQSGGVSKYSYRFVKLGQ